MQVALHFGAPYTDENRLQMCLGKNRTPLADAGILIPRPAQFRKRLRPLMTEVLNAADTTALREDFLSSLAGETNPSRVILSADNFLGFPRTAISEDQFFPGPFNRLVSFLRLFEGCEVELFYAIRNPATFIQSLMGAHPGEEVGALTNYSNALSLRWSDFFERVLEDCPQSQITVWCNEDTPLIWGELLRAVAGLEDTAPPLDGQYDLLADILTKEGYQRLLEYLEKRPDLTLEQRRRAIIAFLEKFADEDALEEELDVPGWTEDLVEQMTELYDEDVGAIAEIPGVRLIEP